MSMIGEVKNTTLLALLAISLCMTPVFAYAQVGAPSGGSGPITSPESEPDSSGGFVNPLGGAGLDSIERVLVKVIKALLGLVALFALLALVWGGIKLIISLGDSKAVEEAKKAIFWALAGVVVAGGAYIIITTITGFLGI